MKTSLCKT